MKKILLILFILFLSLNLTSCGARKTESKSEEIKEQSQIKTNSQVVDTSTLNENLKTNTSTESTTKIDDKDETVVKETTYEPKDISKPAIITDENGKKIVLENVKKTTKETIQKNNKKTDNTLKSDVVSSVDTKLKKESKNNSVIDNKKSTESKLDTKETDKKPFNVMNLLWLLIPIGLIVIVYWVWRKYKSVIPI